MENNKAQLVLYASFIINMDGEGYIRIVTNSQRNRDEDNAIWIGWDIQNNKQDIARTDNPKGKLLSLLSKFNDYQTIHWEFNEKEWIHCNNPYNKKEKKFLDHHYAFSKHPEAMLYVHTLIALTI